jgi:protein ImuB
MFGALYAADGTAREALEGVARDFSPRIEVCGEREIVLDLIGLTRLFGDVRAIAEELRRTAADRHLRVRVAIAATRSAARLLVHHRAGITIVAPGTEADAVAALPLGLLAVLCTTSADSKASHAHGPSAHGPNANGPSAHGPHAHGPNTNGPNANGPNAHGPNAHAPNGSNDPNDPNDLLQTLRRWGLRTIGELAQLPSDDVAARLGQQGVEWQRLARGEDARPLVPALPEERFEQALDLEWPIEGLEPLSFVLARLLEPLEAHLEHRDRGAASLHVRLHLIKSADGTRAIHERTLQLPAPMRDARALRTLALLDLESHPPAAAIDRVVVAVDPTPGRVVQFSLLTRALPSPERLSTLMARLAAVMGEDRCGSPAAVDTWQPGAFAMKPFAPLDSSVIARDSDTPRCVGEEITVAIRRFRTPLPARVRVEDGRPVRVAIDRRGFSGGHVETAAGPWRTSGAWWRGETWERDEWDVSLSDGATYRVFRERDADRWFIEGVVD